MVILVTKKITYKEYKKILNLIAFKIIESKKPFNHRKQYSYAGKKYSYEKVLKKIKSNGENYTSNGYIARFTEKTIVKDNKNLDFLPSNVKRGDSKYKSKHYVKAIQNTVAYRKKHGKNPKKVEIEYTPILKKFGRSTSYGCDNRGQNNSYYCACHMAQEIVRNLTGIVIPQRTIAQVMGTGEDGTGHDGINTFFAWFNKNYKYVLDWEWKDFSDVGWDGLKKICESDNQDDGIHENYRDTWGHYTNFDAIYEDTIDVHNSLGDRCDGSCYCGYTENRDKSDARRYINGISQKSVLIVTRKA